MHVDQFHSQMTSDLNFFVNWWKNRHHEVPDLYPLSLDTENTGVWMEQFLYYVECVKAKQIT